MSGGGNSLSKHSFLTSSTEEERSRSPNAEVNISSCHPATWAAPLGVSKNSGNRQAIFRTLLPLVLQTRRFTFLLHGPGSAPVLPSPGPWQVLPSQVPELALVPLLLTGSASASPCSTQQTLDSRLWHLLKLCTH